MSPHIRDEWVDVTSIGDATPCLVLAVDGREVEISEAQALYIAGRITVEELEQLVDKALGR